METLTGTANKSVPRLKGIKKKDAITAILMIL